MKKTNQGYEGEDDRKGEEIKHTESEHGQNKQTKLQGKMVRPGIRRASSKSTPDHQPSSGVEVTAMMSST